MAVMLSGPWLATKQIIIVIIADFDCFKSLLAPSAVIYSPHAGLQDSLFLCCDCVGVEHASADKARRCLLTPGFCGAFIMSVGTPSICSILISTRESHRSRWLRRSKTSKRPLLMTKCRKPTHFRNEEWGLQGKGAVRRGYLDS